MKEIPKKTSEIRLNDTFVTQDERIKGNLMRLGYAFSVAVAENNKDLAEKIVQEAIALKKG